MENRRKLIHQELAYQIIGAAMEVHSSLGHGFFEKVYEKALLHELKLRGLAVRPQCQISIRYKGKAVGHYIADIIVEDKVVVELKAVDRLARAHIAQAVNYLAASDRKLAILLNFGAASLEYKRVVR